MDFFGFLPNDIIELGVVAAFLALLLHLTTWRGSSPWVYTTAWCLVLASLFGAWYLAEDAEREEKQRLTSMVAGFPPTYALELERLGHSALTKETPPDDPNYLSMIEAEKRWLLVNPAVNDVYTFRREPDGKTVLIVDAETDYDRNGKFDGEREQRTALGEVYPDVNPGLEQAFQTGKPTFDPEPYTDRWGTWVSAYSPMHKADGSLDAVLGVDFSATAWSEAIIKARQRVLLSMGVLMLAVMGLATVGAVSVHQSHSEAKRRENEQSVAAKAKFETLVNSLDGIVWERNPETMAFTFSSQQAGEILGFPPERWLETPSVWERSLHADDVTTVLERLRHAAQSDMPYYLEYRLHACDGRMLWIRESGNTSQLGEGAGSAMRGVMVNVTEQKKAQEALEDTTKQLLDTSRRAGMAEVATGVLHNVGNVLNSVNVSSSLMHDRLRQSKLPSLARLADLLREQGNHLAAFLVDDERGRLVPDYLAQLSKQLVQEHDTLSNELDQLVNRVEHIKDIVVMQQDYAKVAGRSERLALNEVLEDALRFNSASFSRHGIEVIRQIEKVPVVVSDRHKIMQILTNLIRNAKHATQDADRPDRRIVLGLNRLGESRVRIVVSDNGVGIPAENLARIFNHGFTTKPNGHGFGLHSSANACKELGGSLSVDSKGSGQGATFTIELPIERNETLTMSPTSAPLVIAKKASTLPIALHGHS